MTSVFQGLSLSRSVERVGENPGNEDGSFAARWVDRLSVVTVALFVLLYRAKTFSRKERF